jgi:hypothetical protein
MAMLFFCSHWISCSESANDKNDVKNFLQSAVNFCGKSKNLIGFLYESAL